MPTDYTGCGPASSDSSRSTVSAAKQLLWDITQRLLTNPRILRLDGDGLEMRDFLYAEDAARLVVHIAASRPRSRSS